MNLRRVLFSLASFLALVLATPALAVSWSDYQLGAYYQPSAATDPDVRDAAHGIVFFGNATGFVISPEGHVLTNYHVFETFGYSGTVYLEWTTAGYAQRLTLNLITANQAYDVALYKANASRLPYVPIRTRSARVGENVFVIGHPNTRAMEVSFGRVLATGLHIAGRPSVEYSAQTWWGSSGSPVCDEDGNALAIHWGWDANGQSNGRLTGVPFDLITQAIPQIRQIAQTYGAGAAVATTPPPSSSLGSSATTSSPPPTSSTTGSSTTGTTSGSRDGSVFDLALGATARDALNGAGMFHYYRVTLPARGNLSVALNGPSGADFDLLVWQWAGGSQSGRKVGEARSQTATERITVRDAQPGTYYVIVHSYRGAGAYTVQATFAQPTTVATGSTAGTVTTTAGFFAAAGDWVLYRFDARGGNVKIDLNGPNGTDFDVYAYRGGLVDPSRLVGKGDSPNASETFSFYGYGTYAILVRSDRGAGRFTVRVTH